MNAPITNAPADERKWYHKLRYILPISFLIAFTTIYFIWKDYPNRLIRDDQSESASKKESLQNRNLNDSGLWIYGVNSQLNIPNPISLEENTLQSKYEEIGGKYGTYGDTYGSLNALFTGWAFAGLIISIFLQMLELKATRKELAEQKDALVGQQKEFSAQTEILNRQADLVENQYLIVNNQLIESKKKNFIDQFNALMEEKRFIIQNLSIPHATMMDKSILGMNVFGEYAKQFRKIRNVDSENLNEQFFKSEWDLFIKHKYDEYDYSIFSYLRLCRFLFEFVKKNDIYSDEEKNIYFNIIKVSISTEEKAVWMWVGIFRPNTRKMCDNFSVLDGYYAKSMESIGAHFFKRNAFGPSSNWDEIFEEEYGFSDNQG